MSLDVYLEGAPSDSCGSGIFVRENGCRREITRFEWDAKHPGIEPVVFKGEAIPAFTLNITHNLGPMASRAGIYHHLWRPETIAISTAALLIAPLEIGLDRLKADPDGFRALNPENGWGTYEGLVQFVERYLEACRANPTAHVWVSR